MDSARRRVGEPIRWPGPRNMQKTGRTVVAIDDGPPCWRVFLSPVEPPDGWPDPILCDLDVEVDV